MRCITKRTVNLLALLAILWGTPLWSDDGGITQPVSLRFLDSATGMAIIPEGLTLLDYENRQTLPITPLESTSPDRMSFWIADGNYIATVQSDGYQPMNVRVNVAGETPPAMNIFLDPLETPSELTASYLDALRRDDATLVTGFISDAESGFPLAGARVMNPLDGTETTTNSNGYFRIYLDNARESGVFRVEKNGYITQEYAGIELWPHGDWQYPIRLQPGAGSENINEGKAERGTGTCADCEPPEPVVAEGGLPPLLLSLTIRVGRNCGGGPTSCTSVDVLSLETYCKRVLVSEWFSCWGSLPNGLNSMQAGAIAIRSYAAWHMYNSISGSYDICDNTFCQFLGNSQTSNGNFSVDATAGRILRNAIGQVVRAEYAAENNNKGCGNGYTGTGSSWPCISDPVCINQTPNGHGRGMCQWGSARWANGTAISTASPCNAGPTHGNGTKNWEEILNHYYPDYEIGYAVGAELISAQGLPSNVSPGETTQLIFALEALSPSEFLLGASIAPSGSFDWIDDPDNDVLLSLNAGTNAVGRDFDIPTTVTVGGSYDVLAAVWFDSDENGIINSGDLQVHSVRFENVLTMNVTGLTPVNDLLPGTFELGQNYPNPFNPTTTIQFSLPSAGWTTLKIFDTLGRNVAVLTAAQLSAGNYAVNWDASALPAGVYYYRMTVTGGEGATSFTDSKRLILAR